MRSRKAPFTMLIALFLAACDGTEPIVPGTLSISTGTGQTATAGSAVPIAPAVLVKDTRGRPMNRASVTFAIGTGGGSIPAATVTTGVDGIARIASWTLGTTAGVNTLIANVSGLPPVTFIATSTPGAPAIISAAAGDAQTAQVATIVPVAPAVTVEDAHGNAVPGVQVSFAVTSGGGAIAQSNDITDATGTAHAGAWTLGTQAGDNTVAASVAGVTTFVFHAKANAGPAHALVLQAGGNQVAEVAQAVAVPPSIVVQDAFGNAVAGVTVTFSAAQGSGSVMGETQITNAQGTATIGSWTLGTTAGMQSLFASVNAISPLTITALAKAGAAASIAANSATDQTATSGAIAAVRPSVIVHDAFDNLVQGAQVVFEVVSGGGTITGAQQQTNKEGVATLTSWRLGATPGANVVEASISGLGAVEFAATGVAAPPPVAPGYSIEIRYVTLPNARQQLAVQRAVERWQSVIVGDQPDLHDVNIDANACGDSPAFVNSTIDDIVIVVDFSNIDGVGKVLGQASPCFVRSSNGLTVLGELRLDASDLAGMETDGTIDPVVLHEIGHVLGIGTLWNSNNLLANAVSDSSAFTGPSAGEAFRSLGGAASFHGVPAENCVGIPGCGPGTRDSHWRELVMGRELMTGYISPAGTPDPLSRITIQSLADLGYVVDVSRADSYTVGLSLRAGPEAAARELVESAPRQPIRMLNANGDIVR